MNSLAKNIAQAINDFNSIRAAIEEKGAAIGNVPTSTYAEKILSLDTQQVFYKTSGVPYPQHLEFPETMTKLTAWNDCTELLSVKLSEHLENVDVASCFANCTKLESAVLPKSVDGLRLGTRFFQYCKALKNVELPSGIIGLSTNDFDGCTSLESLTIPDDGNFTYISTNVFKNCTSLKTINIPATVTLMQDSAFYNCTNLELVTLGQGYCKSLNLSASDKFSADTIVAMFNSLADLTGSDAQTLTLGAVNLAKVTEEQKQIATNKNWNLA